MEHTYEKKTEILNAAIYLFSTKNFTSTSVQDIASYCNISKATIYKIFKSKEEILMEIIKHLNKQMLFTVENVDLKSDSTPTETLEKKIYVFFEHLSTRREFSVMIYQNQDLVKNKDIEKLLIESKLFILNWYKTILIDAFGDKVQNIIWDVIISMSGLVKEFCTIFITKDFVIQDLETVAKFIVKNITCIVESHHNDEPLIPASAINFFNIDSDVLFNKELLLNEWDSTIIKLKSRIEACKSILKKDDVIAAITALDIEQKSNPQKKYMIDALFLYLLKFKSIEREIIFLKQLHSKI